ncbi:MAG: glycoside hydrolase family 9 protein [Actinomycetota bacterium]|nr:glycoside hydrolase family 9 protein [Actinomycetota bacterium]
MIARARRRGGIVAVWALVVALAAWGTTPVASAQEVDDPTLDDPATEDAPLDETPDDGAPLDEAQDDEAQDDEAQDGEAPAEQVTNGGFDDGLNGWNAFPNAAVVDGWGCIDVPAGTEAYAAGILQQLPITEGEAYDLSFRARLVSGTPGALRTIVQLPRDPYTAYLPEQAISGELGAEPTDFAFSFTATESLDDAELAVVQQTAVNAEAYTVCVDDISLTGGSEAPPYEPDTGPRVRVNQVGYTAGGPKHATLVTDATEAMLWELHDAEGNVVETGVTRPRGVDPTAGLAVHTIGFSDVTATGEGFTVVADGETSFPFRIGVADVYDQLRIDALNYYYGVRSGTEIIDTDEIAPTDIGGDSYARPPGHVSTPSDGETNLGDVAVPCQSPANQTGPDGSNHYGAAWSCPDGYALDVTGGWYDAGDHGKYVVNGGISVYQLMNLHERSALVDAAEDGALGDSTLAIPERGNGTPDVLDEARWELELLLAMQVPAGTAPFDLGGEAVDLSGMAHHKIHDEGWTGLPLMPHEDPQVRSLHRPSTAATLNLAAVAAQGARLFEPYDPAFAAELLVAARAAWAAAEANPALYAPAADGADGGGPYDDDDVSDERYWAAAELYLTTGEAEFADAVTSSPWHEGEAFTTEGFSWGDVAALARIDLALVPNDLPDRDRVAASVVAAADALVEVVDAQPFGHAYAGADGDYVWGSNSQLLNNIVVLGVAHDLAPSDDYLRAAFESMDYLFGRNALNWSYVTGYGADGYNAVNQHSRWWADQLDPSLPNPPPGSVSGGPNSLTDTWDPVISSLYPGEDCAPQRCYVDDIQSWSTNEITINWNSALSWVASFLADHDDADPATGVLGVSVAATADAPSVGAGA